MTPDVLIAFTAASIIQIVTTNPIGNPERKILVMPAVKMRCKVLYAKRLVVPDGAHHLSVHDYSDLIDGIIAAQINRVGT